MQSCMCEWVQLAHAPGRPTDPLTMCWCNRSCMHPSWCAVGFGHCDIWRTPWSKNALGCAERHVFVCLCASCSFWSAAHFLYCLEEQRRAHETAMGRDPEWFPQSNLIEFQAVRLVGLRHRSTACTVDRRTCCDALQLHAILALHLPTNLSSWLCLLVYSFGRLLVEQMGGLGE